MRLRLFSALSLVLGLGFGLSTGTSAAPLASIPVWCDQSYTWSKIIESGGFTWGTHTQHVSWEGKDEECETIDDCEDEFSISATWTPTGLVDKIEIHHDLVLYQTITPGAVDGGTITIEEIKVPCDNTANISISAYDQYGTRIGWATHLSKCAVCPFEI